MIRDERGFEVVLGPDPSGKLSQLSLALKGLACSDNRTTTGKWVSLDRGYLPKEDAVLSGWRPRSK